MPPPLVRAIAALHAREYPDDSVSSVTELGLAGADDTRWIASLAQNEEPWTVVTRDLMRRERSHLQSGDPTWFLLHRGWAGMPYWAMSWKFVKAWPDVVNAGRRAPGPVFTVALNGRVQQAR